MAGFHGVVAGDASFAFSFFVSTRVPLKTDISVLRYLQARHLVSISSLPFPLSTMNDGDGDLTIEQHLF